MAIQTRIIDVFSKLGKCPVCGSEVVTIICPHRRDYRNYLEP